MPLLLELSKLRTFYQALPSFSYIKLPSLFDHLARESVIKRDFLREFIIINLPCDLFVITRLRKTISFVCIFVQEQ